MKYVLVVGDGMADTGIEKLNGKTPLEYLTLPGFDVIGGGEVGRARTCPPRMSPGSDVAFLSILGNDPTACYTGRSPLEAAGCGVLLKEGEVSFRMNLVSIKGDSFEDAVILSHNGGQIEGEDAENLVLALLNDAAFMEEAAKIHMRITPSRTFRHVAVIRGDGTKFDLTPPHDVLEQNISSYLPKGQAHKTLENLMRLSYELLSNHPINRKRKQEGLLPANCIWFWGAGTSTSLCNFKDKYNHYGSVISAVPLVRGIALLGGLDAPILPGATGVVDTDYEGKLDCALASLKAGNDFALIHIEAPDECTHDGDTEGKLEAIRRIDGRIVQPLLDEMPEIDVDYRIMLISDHYTLTSTRTHDGTPVPYAIFDSRKVTMPRKFCESGASESPILEDGYRVIERLFEMI